MTSTTSVTTPRRALAPKLRRTLLTVHVVASVGLLGEIAGFLAVALQAARTDDPAFAATSYDLLSTFSIVFGIPLSFTALGTGVALGLGTKWGLLRHWWVTVKLALLASVILVGAFVLGPQVDQLRHGTGGSQTVVILGAAWDVLALSLATGLSVFKPGRRRAKSA
jgi:uncharacterized membrane protein